MKTITLLDRRVQAALSVLEESRTSDAPNEVLALEIVTAITQELENPVNKSYAVEWVPPADDTKKALLASLTAAISMIERGVRYQPTLVEDMKAVANKARYELTPHSDQED